MGKYTNKIKNSPSAPEKNVLLQMFESTGWMCFAFHFNFSSTD